MFNVQTILVPMDFSRSSEHALEIAVEVAKKFGAKLHLLHCYGVDMIAAVPYDPHYVPRIPEDFEAQVRHAAERKLAVYHDRAIAEGLEVDTHLNKLVPSDAILRKAEEIGADMIVMGTQGLTGLKHIVLGSVAERTIRTASCPVLAVKAEDAVGEG